MIRKRLKNLVWGKRFEYIKNILFDEKDLNEKGTRFQIIKFPPNTKINPHFHKKVYEIFYIRSGEGIFHFNNKKYKAQKDDVFLCQPNDIHGIINNSSKELVILIFKTNENPKDLHWIDKK